MHQHHTVELSVDEIPISNDIQKLGGVIENCLKASKRRAEETELNTKGYTYNTETRGKKLQIAITRRKTKHIKQMCTEAESGP